MIGKHLPSREFQCCWVWNTTRITSAILLDLARQRGFKDPAGRGPSQLSPWLEVPARSPVARRVFLPTCWLDVLNRSSDNPETRHIPVQILRSEDSASNGLERGAFQFT